MSEYQQRVKESLSALADGEISELELQRLLRELDGDEGSALRQRWSGYHQQRSLLRGEQFESLDLSSAVAAAIADEPRHARSRWSSLGSNLSRLAVAASVAVFALVGVQQLQTNANQQPALEFAQESLATETYSGPALQFPADFRPALNAQTVSAQGSLNSAANNSATLPSTDGMSEADYLHSRNYLLNLLQRHQAQSASVANPALLPVMLPATLPDGRQIR
ncbi:sigma-E factor negative regulatory protein [Porticoccaceae bacterium]|nr:sigma-E factor negative regulatory protein [Porticoccaceae bacterium]